MHTCVVPALRSAGHPPYLAPTMEQSTACQPCTSMHGRASSPLVIDLSGVCTCTLPCLHAATKEKARAVNARGDRSSVARGLGLRRRPVPVDGGGMPFPLVVNLWVVLWQRTAPPSPHHSIVRSWKGALGEHARHAPCLSRSCCV